MKTRSSEDAIRRNLFGTDTVIDIEEVDDVVDIDQGIDGLLLQVKEWVLHLRDQFYFDKIKFRQDKCLDSFLAVVSFFFIVLFFWNFTMTFHKQFNSLLSWFFLSQVPIR